jgi:hypothetical protein
MPSRGGCPHNDDGPLQSTEDEHRWADYRLRKETLMAALDLNAQFENISEKAKAASESFAG